MGSICESKSNKIPNIRNDYLTDNFDIEEQTLKFNNFIFEDNIQDFIDKKYDLNDPIFRLIRADEKKILEKFYRANKNDMQNDMTLFLKKNQNINFITMLTKQIISNENGKGIFQQKIKDEIQEIYNNEDDSKINYLTIMILGKTGVGKSCLVNNILFGGKEVAKEGIINRVTQVRKTYSSKKVPYIRLVDTVGIELSEKADVEMVGLTAKQFIDAQIKKNDINNFVHCIWYCISDTKFEEEERKLVNKSINHPYYSPSVITKRMKYELFNKDYNHKKGEQNKIIIKSIKDFGLYHFASSKIDLKNK
jgi:predicted GTPase